jgi:hypothetical protein
LVGRPALDTGTMLGEVNLGKHEEWFRFFTFRFPVTLVVAAILASATLAFADDPQVGTYTGIVTCSFCGARHVKHPEMNSTNCTRECVRTGAKYTLIDGEKSYTLQGRFADLTQFAGQRAKVSGSRQGDTIRVTSISEP